MESVNIASANQAALHTTKGCSMSHRRKQSGRTLQSDCYNATNSNAGCGVEGPPGSIGTAFNAAGGGVYALELRDAGIRVWSFARNAMPADLMPNANAMPD